MILTLDWPLWIMLHFVTLCSICGEEHDSKLTCLQAWLKRTKEKRQLLDPEIYGWLDRKDSRHGKS